MEETKHHRTVVDQRFYGSRQSIGAPAGWKPAIQQVGSLRYDGGATASFLLSGLHARFLGRAIYERHWLYGRSADWKSAIRQVGNLRYFQRLSHIAG